MNKNTRTRHARSINPARDDRPAGADTQEDAPALPRTSRFRSHDHEGDYVRGCLGTPARYEAGSSDPQS